MPVRKAAAEHKVKVAIAHKARAAPRARAATVRKVVAPAPKATVARPADGRMVAAAIVPATAEPRPSPTMRSS